MYIFKINNLYPDPTTTGEPFDLQNAGVCKFLSLCADSECFFFYINIKISLVYGISQIFTDSAHYPYNISVNLN